MPPALQLTVIKVGIFRIYNTKRDIQAIAQTLQSFGGVKCVYFGPALDAEDTVVLAVVWNDYALTQSFVKSEDFETYFKQLEDFATERPKTTHCLLKDPSDELKTLFTAAAIEMAPLKLKGDRIHQHYNNFIKAGKMIAAAKGYVAQFQQPQVEDPYVKAVV
ncbi:hypothetical protein LTR47_008939 [Exophiala xenobiotica]|nr:hypothetical protein LTR47_008939 [Exophiala xenobiotica]KAK5244217.1 hypothetical protein LTS06_010170 [Exophiala xenobiotica]KAK5282628.1 hypothetical protein LTR40_003024 [Exophiala xenobiotica]KAK5347586.1 hypothetical protein LTR61_008857 [Exophiala xenobiotica]KAK5362679.1 hypothetical protein LTS03_009997 [Exophiala xenobiotica]